MSIPGDWLRLALNYAPPLPLTCALFTALRRDLLNVESPHYAEYTRLSTGEHLQRLHGKDGVCAQIMSKLHGAKELLEEHNKDAELGGRNLALCSHAERVDALQLCQHTTIRSRQRLIARPWQQACWNQQLQSYGRGVCKK